MAIKPREATFLESANCSPREACLPLRSRAGEPVFEWNDRAVETPGCRNS